MALKDTHIYRNVYLKLCKSHIVRLKEVNTRAVPCIKRKYHCFTENLGEQSAIHTWFGFNRVSIHRNAPKPSELDFNRICCKHC